MYSNKQIARIGGFLYLLLILFGVFAEKYVRNSLIVADNAALTTRNITDNVMLFKMGFVADLLMLVTYFLLPLVLYQLFKKTSRALSGLMVFCVIVAVAIMCSNMLNHYAPLLLLHQNGFENAFNVDQIHSSVLFYMQMHTIGYHIAQLFFGLWLLPLGYLLIRSGQFPIIIGILLMIGCTGYLVDFIIYFLFPGHSSTLTQFVTAPADIGEFSLCLYLLVQGVKGNHSTISQRSTE